MTILRNESIVSKHILNFLDIRRDSKANIEVRNLDNEPHIIRKESDLSKSKFHQMKLERIGNERLDDDFFKHEDKI